MKRKKEHKTLDGIKYERFDGDDFWVVCHD